jgi:hypothetical protein
MPTANPTYSDIKALLDILIPPTDANIASAPHQAFWRNLDRNGMIALTTAQWGVDGQLVVPGNPATSNLYLALAGKPPFDGSELPQMPDVSADPNARLATPEELAMVSAWISKGAPA